MSVFNALNRFISKLDAGSSPDADPGDGLDPVAAGFQVLRNTRSEVPLEPWFDFIVGINGRAIVGA